MKNFFRSLLASTRQNVECKTTRRRRSAKRIKAVFLLLLLVFGCLPIPVLAETATYTALTSGECLTFSQNGNSYYHVTVTGTDVRAVIIRRSGYTYLDLVSESPFNYWYGSSQDTACSVPNKSATTYGNYYVYGVSASFGTLNGAIPAISCDTSKNASQWAIYYTFGEGAVAPIEPINWGQLRDVVYSTKIAGSGDASLANVDTITWSTDFDTFGNEITESCMVDIRAVRGSWTAGTKEDLLNLAGNSIVLENTVAPVLATLSASTGTFSIEWEDVISELNIDSYISLLAMLINTNQNYVKEGWIYQIRLTNDLDNYHGTWQTIYTATSSTAQGSESLIINNDMNMNVNQMLQEIAILNNQETVNININETNYYVENPNNGTEPQEGTDLWELLKTLISGIFQILTKLGDIAVAIVQAISDMVTALINGIVDLFTFDSFDVPGFDDQKEDLKENSGVFGEALGFEEDLKTAIDSAVADHSEAEPIFSTNGITIMDVQVIPATTINLNDYMDDLEEAGWSNAHSYIYMITDGFIWFSLIALVLRKLHGVLKQ